jgi:MauM/NapG family ferredoxin protein
MFGVDPAMIPGKTAYSAVVEGFDEPLPHIKLRGLIRPPGALPEREFRAKCISCGVCVDVWHAMKFDALAIKGFGDLTNFGTPYLKDVRDFPCTLCMECPKHCPTGALQVVKKEDVKMGMALIDFSLCFGWNGDVCLSCSKACPLGASVFDFYYSDWGNQPVINEKCVGCGLCVRYCPLGGSAVKIVTREQYKEIKDDYYREFQRVLTLDHVSKFNEVYNKNMPIIMSRGRIVERDFR